MVSGGSRNLTMGGVKTTTSAIGGNTYVGLGSPIHTWLSEAKTPIKNSNSFGKIGALSDFIHKGRLIAPNKNEAYHKALSGNPDIFKKDNGMCTEFLNALKNQKFIGLPFRSWTNCTFF